MRATFATLVCAISVGAIAGILRFTISDRLEFIFAALPLLSFSIVGSLLVVRRAGDPIGWLFGAAGALVQLALFAQAYGYASLQTSGALPGSALALWFGGPGSNVATTLLVAALVRFPDGRPPNRAFAILLWSFIALSAIGVVGNAFADHPILEPLQAGEIANPFALHGPLGDLMRIAASTSNIALALALVAPLALVVRFRRSRGVERRQIKWLTYAAAIAFGLTIMALASPPNTNVRVLFAATTVVGIGLLPVAILIAVTRYRLYDIDVLIRRTVIYATISALLAAAYIGGVALFQFVLSPFTSGSPIAVAVSTLLVVALFQPLRSRIGSAVDRQFYRSRYDATRTLDAFSARLRDEVDLDALRGDLLAAVGDTMQPVHASLWLRR